MHEGVNSHLPNRNGLSTEPQEELQDFFPSSNSIHAGVRQVEVAASLLLVIDSSKRIVIADTRH